MNPSIVQANSVAPNRNSKKGSRKMTWVLIIVGSLVALTALVFIVGFMMPEQYEARVRFVIDRPPEQVWAALMDSSNPLSSKMCRKVEAQPAENGLPVWVEDIGASRLTVRTVSAKPHTRYRRTITDSSMPMTADIEVTVEAVEGGSRVAVVNQTTLRRGTWHIPVFRVIIKLTNGVEKGVREYATQVAGKLGGHVHFE